MGVLRLGPCGAAMTLPSGPMAGSRAGRERLLSVAVAPGGGSSPPLRPQPARPRAETSEPIAAVRARRMPREELNSASPQLAAPYPIGQQRRTRGETIPFPCETRNLSALVCQGLKPPVRLPAHIFRGGAAVTGPAFHRILGAEHRKHVFGDALLDRLHGGERHSVKRN